MKTKELVEMGIPQDCLSVALDVLKKIGKIHIPQEARNWLFDTLSHLELYAKNPELQKYELAKAIVDSRAKCVQETAEWGNNPYDKQSFTQWGEADENAIEQMKQAMEIPVAVKGALMADSHLGYAVPIGGVLATYNSVIPMAVGVDIACRVMCTITDIPAKKLSDVFSPKVDPFIRAITGGTVFGVGGTQKVKANHPVMDMDWNVTKITKEMKDRAWGQLGTSGGGNHFCEFGIATLEKPELGLEPGEYIALLTHSGSRGAGGAVCKTYSDIAMSKLPKAYEQYKGLAWLSMDSEAGQEYWKAMNLMGEYASGNHHVIHQRVLELIGGKSLSVIEHHHNFCWKEEHDGKELYVHRKGATPADKGVLGMIPGSMADPAFVVRGKGNPASLMSSSHGAGRKMSRTQAIKTLNWADWKSKIKNRGVRLLSGGLDEVPGVYKDINKIMQQQADLVNIVARFDPKIVKMSDDGKRED